MSTMTATSAAIQTDDGYADFESIVRNRVAAATGPLFTTNADPDALWAAYLDGIPAEHRQHYVCHACRRFIQRYGGLVKIDDGGSLSTTMIWGVDVPSFFLKSVVQCGNILAKSKVTGVFLSSEATWGTPSNTTKGGSVWSHLSGVNPRPFKHALLSADQVMAEKAQDFQILIQGLADYPAPVVAEAVRVLNSDTLTRSEKAVAVAEWFADLHRRLDGTKGPARTNLIWLAVATAPPGFCHVRSTIISTLLDDIKAGMDFATVSRRWAGKLHPLQYQRPQAQPSAGAIDRAEKIFEAMGAAPALARRFATLDDVLAKLWVPAATEADKPAGGGIFDHLRQDAAKVQPLDLPATSITWEKFSRTVLPSALTIEAMPPAVGAFYGLVTAADRDAPPMLQWDGLAGQPRNPTSWYFYTNGSPASRWGLRGGEWTPVTSVFYGPHRWQEPAKFDHQGDNVFFALAGCRESESACLALFPEILRAEFREVRSVIEAHSNRGKLQGAETGNANGIAFQKGGNRPLALRVRTKDGVARYNLDRWD